MYVDHDERLKRTYCSLEGLSVGDAFGETFFVSPIVVDELIATRTLETPPWEFTDDTNMALSIVAILRQYGEIDQERLALSYAERYDDTRGYGPAMHRALARIRQGEPWRTVAGGLFVGQGSFGNGAAMRVAPLGAYFADDLERVVEQARLSAEITHAHPEGIAGAIAVAVGAAWAWRFQGGPPPAPKDFLDDVWPLVPESEVRKGLQYARNLPSSSSVELAVAALGNGSKVSAQDTVPFALWCAAQQMANYEEACWLTVSGQGDRDTTCAIVGGIVTLYTGVEGIPKLWRENREPLPEWPFV